MGYDYGSMICDIEAVTNAYPFAYKFKIGTSLMGKDIICVKIGEGEKKLILCGAYHGLEYITAAFLTAFSRRLCEAVLRGEQLYGRDVRRLIKNVSLSIVPMVNPDGVDIAASGSGDGIKKEIIDLIGNVDFKNEWQANARGVDINHNFDALWDGVLDAPAPSKYGGKHPNSEKETRAIVNFIRREQFDMLIAFHSQGGEIYYDFNGIVPPRALEIAMAMSRESGYKVCCPEGTATFGGCKDWFIQETGKAGFTVEMGHGKNPLPVSMLRTVFEPCARIILCAMEEMLR